ncbi:MAG TPA: hypothetical protein VFF38_04440, partial [Microvirga sp.]|nr:hypothetical protein [Microvirga sp.]
MNDHMAHLRYTAFRRDYLAWTALHHFLPVGLLRELCIAIVDEISSEAVRLGDLFEEEMSDGPIHLQSWIIRPRAVSSPLEEYLQSRIRLLAWTSDTPVGSHTEINDLAGGRPAMFDAAIQLGRIDTGTLPDLHDANFPQSDSAWALVLAIRALETDTVGEGGTNGVIGRLASLDPPLNAVAVKHVGDLCADADRWQEALSLYRNCEGLLREERRAE